ncbi:hypothetical protein [Microbacterium sp. ZW T5_56]|uniref:hypothetical protein n=1 Tax=Microbacterium sp. ZW T5_56 TaxID=3378081 RepID=UPI0038552148
MRASTRDRIATVVSEIGGPSPLLLVGLLQVGLPTGAVLPTLISVLAMAVAPYAATIWLARAGRVDGRFVADRRQRMPILLATLVVVMAGAVAVALLRAPSSLVWLSVVAVAALMIVTVITLRWKISIHATIAAFFAGLQVALFGPIGLIAIAVPLLVMWARYRLRAHTAGQLVAGAALGGALALGYALLV